jgi:uncharacterized protein (DUF433 family)
MNDHDRRRFADAVAAGATLDETTRDFPGATVDDLSAARRFLQAQRRWPPTTDVTDREAA